MRRLKFGDITSDRVGESEGPAFFAEYLFPDSNHSTLMSHKSWLIPFFLDRNSGRLVMSIHTYVIKTPRHVILVDTCVGNDKVRPSTPQWNLQDNKWLQNLKATAGISPEQVDFVLCTHLHVDHVGWNTRLLNGRWVPTFPNAKYLFHKVEYDYWSVTVSQSNSQDKGSNDECFVDSILPIVDGGQALFVNGSHQIDDHLWLEATPGHTPGHVCLHLKAGHQKAIFFGDLMHLPIQCVYPEWNSRFCVDDVQSRLTRKQFLAAAVDSNMLVLGAHFAFPTSGRIVGNKSHFSFQIEYKWDASD